MGSVSLVAVLVSVSAVSVGCTVEGTMPAPESDLFGTPDAGTREVEPDPIGPGDAGAGTPPGEDAGRAPAPPPRPPDAGPRCSYTQCYDERLRSRVCVDLSVTTTHCGECGYECADGLVCSGGRCGCPGGTMLCAGLGCVDLTSDEFSCGACGHECGINSTCQAGRCTCAPGFTLCGGTCVDLTDDERNCGGCGVTCTFGQLCTAGRCGGAVCPTGDVCSPVAGSGCGTGNACYVATPDTTCATRGFVGEGGTCEFANDCASGLSCFYGQCRRPCCGDSDGACGPGRFCMPRLSDGYGVCMPDAGCDPVRQRGCAAGVACYSWYEITFCIGSSRGTREGEPCNYSNACAPGLHCDDPEEDDSGICRQYCDLGDPSCPSGRTCRPVPYDSARPWLGICL